MIWISGYAAKIWIESTENKIIIDRGDFLKLNAKHWLYGAAVVLPLYVIIFLFFKLLGGCGTCMHAFFCTCKKKDKRKKRRWRRKHNKDPPITLVFISPPSSSKKNSRKGGGGGGGVDINYTRNKNILKHKEDFIVEVDDDDADDIIQSYSSSSEDSDSDGDSDDFR